MDTKLVTLSTRVFSLADQQSFAAWSGDRNPMHVDPVAARRTQAGAPVVHGINALLWAANELYGSGVVAPRALRIEARFKRFLYVDEPIELRPGSRGRFDLFTGGASAATFSFEEVGAPVELARTELPPAADRATVPHEPVELAFEELAGKSGTLALPGSSEAAQRYPALGRALGPTAVAAIAALSTLVGMAVPGLHSIFDGLDIAVGPADHAGLAYAVSEVDDRFRLVTMRVRGGGIAGDVRAFLRQPPVLPDRAALAQIVPAEFAATRALVVGGSRGLGAATVRALAAGGATVTFTYARGEAEARALVTELGPRVSTLRLDVCDDVGAPLASLGPIDHAYYFATPHISRREAGWFSYKAFEAFARVYVRGFAQTCAAVHARSRDVRIYYPSSIYVDAAQRPRDMLEYAAAKAAGEALCAELPRALRGALIEVERLPRVATDQTASIVPSEAASAERLALAAVRRMHALG